MFWSVLVVEVNENKSQNWKWHWVHKQLLFFLCAFLEMSFSEQLGLSPLPVGAVFCTHRICALRVWSKVPSHIYLLPFWQMQWSSPKTSWWTVMCSGCGMALFCPFLVLFLSWAPVSAPHSMSCWRVCLEQAGSVLPFDVHTWERALHQRLCASPSAS